MHECGQTDDGSPYIAMDFLEGESLRQTLKRRGTLPLPETAEILNQTARGLHAAHKLGIIHRDLKPDNIFLTHDDDGKPLVKIVDFGIAKMREATTHPVTGGFLGTPAYMSVEQAAGMRSDQLDGRSDIYSLGIVTYEMIVGRKPFQADTDMAYLNKHLNEPPPPLQRCRPDLRISPQLDDVVMKALKKKRDERYPTAPDFAREFALAIAQPSETWKQPTAPRPQAREKTLVEIVPPPKFLARYIAGVAALVAVALGGWYALSTGPSAKPAPVPSAPVGINPKDEQRYVYIPSGSFLMGCSTGDSECFDWEKPQHRVTLTKGFWIGQTAVTVEAWKRYRIATGTTALPAEDNVGRKNWNEAGDGNMPAVMMTWDEAKSYCQWASMRLPTEAEWEYAARAGTTAARYGDLDAIAWYGDNSGSQRIDSMALWNQDSKTYAQKLHENRNFVHGVALKQPNAWKLYDMLGNVYAWTADWYDAGYYAKSEGEDPLGPPGGQYRVVRGGSWNGYPQLVRLSNRGRIAPANLYDFIGCRCVGELP